MKKEFLTMALAATVITGGFLTADAVPCKAGEAPEAAAQSVMQTKAPETCNLPRKKPEMKKLTPEERKAIMEKRVEEFNKTLGLTDEQVAKAKEIRAQGHNKMKPLMEKKKAKFQEMRTLEANSSMSVKAQDKKAEALRNDMRKIDQQMRQIRRDNEKEFEAILTPEQKIKLEQIKEEGRKHFREHKMPQGPENFRRGPGGPEGFDHRGPGAPVGDHRYRPLPKAK